MSTTTIRLTEELKARIARAAERSGTTPHGFILGALEEKVGEAERRRDFVDEAERRWQAFVADGQVFAWEDMREYLARRAQGERPALPAKKTFGREP
ncbi:CopG family ribbon-helix-helix protein [Lysobacter sp. 1R34A]|uniref:CopG family ribbon-helix-helix protein n=1 Tax=Lysobacter sp. 1R34A TaxID=3445786 RepID=UPI003EEB639A